VLEYRQVSDGHPLTRVIFVTQKPAMTSVTSPSPSLPTGLSAWTADVRSLGRQRILALNNLC